MMAAFMDEVVIDPISGEQLSERHAVFVPFVEGLTDIMEYLKSVGNIVGPTNIRSAYKVGNKIKMYLRFRKHVEELVINGIRLKETFASIDFCVPPATQVLLREVDTEIPNQILIEHLELYGKVVSKVVTLKILVADPEFSHIETNVRKVFVDFNIEAIIPATMKVTHGLKEYSVEIDIQDFYTGDILPELSISPTKQEEEDSQQYDVNQQNLKWTNADRYSSQHCFVSLQNMQHDSGDQCSSQVSKKHKRKASKVIARPSKERLSNRSFRRSVYTEKVSEIITNKNSTGTSRKSQRNQAESQLNSYDHDGMNCQLIIHNSENSISLTGGAESPSSLFEDFVIPTSSTSRKSFSLTEFPFTRSKLEDFLRRVKNNRNPTGVALKMLEENGTVNCTSKLCDQLNEYSQVCQDAGIRFRILRLVDKLSQKAICE